MCGQLATLCITERRWSKQLVLSCVKSQGAGIPQPTKETFVWTPLYPMPIFSVSCRIVEEWSGVECREPRPLHCRLFINSTAATTRPVCPPVAVTGMPKCGLLTLPLSPLLLPRSHMQVRPTCRIQITQVISHMPRILLMLVCNVMVF